MRSAEWRESAGRLAPFALALAIVFTPHSAFRTPRLEAHPVPRGDYDRNLTVTWRTDGVHILYRLEIDQFSLVQTVGKPENGFPLDPNKGFGQKDAGDAYVAVMRKI